MAKVSNKQEQQKKKNTPIIVQNKRGNNVRLLRPNERGSKFALELKENIRYTNMGKPSVDKDGVVQSLSKAQRSFRAGYLAARKDNAMAYNYKNNKPAYDKAKEKQRAFWASRKKGDK